MKKNRRTFIIFILIAVLVIVAAAGFLLGRFLGAGAARKETDLTAQQTESTIVAVVNLDEGTASGDTNVNYAESLSEFPDPDFEYSSLEEARSGFESGQYGAYIIIPATFSKSVESINDAPQASFLEYAVNQNYTGETQYELLYKVVSYANTLNDNLSYMYLSNILQEFHDAQDGAVTVMANDLTDKDAIDRIQAYDLVALVPVPELVQEENTTETLDITPYTEKNAQLSQSIDDQYMLCVTQIQEQIQTMQESGIQLSDVLTSLSEQVAAIDLTVDDQGESIAGKADEALTKSLEDYVEGAPDKDELCRQLQTVRDDYQYIKDRWNKSNEIYNSQLQERLKEELGKVLSAAASAIPELTVTGNGTDGYTVTLAGSAEGAAAPSLVFTMADDGTQSAQEELLKQITVSLAQAENTKETILVSVNIGESSPGAGDGQPYMMNYDVNSSVKTVLSQWDDEAQALGYLSAADFLDKYGTGQVELPDGKYIQYSGETGAFASYIRDGVNSTDTAAYSIEEVKDWLYDDEGNTIRDDKGRPVSVSSLIDQEDEELKQMIEDLAACNELDIQSVRDLVKTQYIDPIEANAAEAKETFIQRNEDEKAGVAAYNEEMSEFSPEINSQFITENIADMTANNQDLQADLTENNMAYMDYANNVFQAAQENVSSLQEYINETKESSDAAVTGGLDEAKDIKADTSWQNQNILDAFSKKLPYTRLGSAESTQTYQFIASPVKLLDTSDESRAAEAQTTSGQATEQEDGGFPWEIAYIIAAVLVLILLILLFRNSRKTKEGQ